jgi:hypothetical protein
MGLGLEHSTGSTPSALYLQAPLNALLSKVYYAVCNSFLKMLKVEKS